MRRLILWNMVTLDGYFEGPNKWDIDWHEYTWGAELEAFSLEQARAADLLLFGRITYQGMASYWRNAEGDVADFMNSVRKIVFSRTLTSVEWDNSEIISAGAPAEIERLKAETGKDILIFGSAELSSALLKEGLIDELRIGVNPVILGEGVPLFKPVNRRIRLHYLGLQETDTGCVILRYEPLVEEHSIRDAIKYERTEG